MFFFLLIFLLFFLMRISVLTGCQDQFRIYYPQPQIPTSPGRSPDVPTPTVKHIFSACPASALGSPSSIMWLTQLKQDPTWRYPHKLHKPPQLNPLNFSEPVTLLQVSQIVKLLTLSLKVSPSGLFHGLTLFLLNPKCNNRTVLFPESWYSLSSPGMLKSVLHKLL